MPEREEAHGHEDNAPDTELRAIQDILTALTKLNPEARKRVIGYVFERLGLAPPSPAGFPGAASAQAPARVSLDAMPAPARQIADIRSFKEQKKPRSSTEMAALVAYYLAELAPATERKDEITSQDISKYFKQANYPLPGRPRQTLFDAKNAGYIDAGSSRGGYKLNPVGHNLVAHSLPAGEARESEPKPRAVRRRARKLKKPSPASRKPRVK